MAVMKVETKNKVEISKKPRVYFTCHPNDFDSYFQKICGDIFRTHDCAIYYTSDMTESITEDYRETDLGRNNLFVIPVTYALLTTPNRAMDEDFSYAKKEHIPVLPVMMEPGLVSLYSQPDKFGELQYLNPYSTDPTEISYEEKLKKYLESVLIDDKMAKRIRSAFDANIFLSYRKKDRKYANQLMRLIHSYPEFRDIAIWFDEFLIPGESFKEAIENVLANSQLFTLLVTPNLLEEPDGKPNFVMEKEYPTAKNSGMDILAVEMKITDKDALRKKFQGIPDCIDPHKDEVLKSCLLEIVKKLSITPNNTPEHTFLIGLAYLEGIDMEVDRDRGTKMIHSAAENNDCEAIIKLVDMYENGIGLPYSIENAAMWQNRLVSILEKKYKKSHNPTDLVSLFWTRHHCAQLYTAIKKYEYAEAKINNILPRLLAVKTRTGSIIKQRLDILNCILYSFLLLSHISVQKGDLSRSEDLLEKAQSFYNNIIIPMDANDEQALLNSILLNYEMMYLQLAKQYKELHHYEKALEYAKRALRIVTEHIPETSSFYNCRLEIEANEIAGDACFYSDDFSAAEKYYSTMYRLAKATAEASEDPLAQRDFAYACNRMGELMLQKSNLKDAKTYFLHSFHISKSLRSYKNDDDTGNLAFCYTRFGDIYWRKSRMLLRARCYRKAAKIRSAIFESSRDPDSMMHLAYAYINLSRISLFRRKYYLAKAKTLFEALIQESQIPDFYEEELRKWVTPV